MLSMAQMLQEMHDAGWSVTLLCWADGSDGKWTCDVQVGDELTDPDFCNDDVDPLVAVTKTYEEWKAFVRA